MPPVSLIVGHAAQILRFTMLMPLMLLGAGCGAEDTSSRPPTPPADAILSAEDMPGCYELVWIKWAPGFRSEAERQVFSLPRFFRLTADVSLSRGRIVPRNNNDPDGSWRLIGDRELAVIWRTWPNGATVRMTVRRRAAETQLYGRAEPFAEGPGNTPPTRAAVIMAKVRCWPGSEGEPWIE